MAGDVEALLLGGWRVADMKVYVLARIETL